MIPSGLDLNRIDICVCPVFCGEEKRGFVCLYVEKDEKD